MRWLDLLHARLQNDSLFFTKGFGDPEILQQPLIVREPPRSAQARPLAAGEDHRILRFLSPQAERLPPASRVAEALVVMPEGWDYTTPVCVQLAATGDEGFVARQRLVAKPLTALGVGSIILENPFYGSRRPTEQVKTYLQTVSDLWALGLGVVAEARAILGWLREQGFQNLGVCGVSLGGAMTCEVAALTPYPIACCACIAPHSATPVFLEGVLSHYVDWEALGPGGRELLASQLDGSDLRKFPRPLRPDCVVWLGAKHDAYVDPASTLLAAENWPGSKLVWLNNGHVGTTLFHKNQYLRAILESFRCLQSQTRLFDSWLP